VISVSSAVETDDATLQALRSIGSTELADERGAAALFRELGAITPGLVLVGRIGDVVVAYLTATITPTVSVVHELYVRAEARGVGVGRALLTATQKIADGSGSPYLESVVLPGMRASKNFFEAHGLVAQRIVVGRTLTSP